MPARILSRCISRSISGPAIRALLAGCLCLSAAAALAQAPSQSPLSEMQMRAERGNAYAQNNLGQAYLTGQQGLTKDETKAAYWFTKAAEQGDESAEYNLAVMYMNGQGGLTQDPDEAAKWFRKAAESGDVNAQSTLGLICAQGTPKKPADRAEAVSWWRKAADQGDASAQTNLAIAYINGDGGLPHDESQAVALLKKAADGPADTRPDASKSDAPRGDPTAQADLALLYATSGDPLINNPSGALTYAQKAVAATRTANTLGALASAYFANKDYANAVNTLKQAIALATPDQKARYDDELKQYQEALDAAPKSAPNATSKSAPDKPTVKPAMPPR